jgi:lipoprotein-anchoring transpeptidase ErfK/SrfK
LLGEVEATVRSKIWLVIAFLLTSGPALPASIDAQTINEAEWSNKKLPQGTLSPEVVKLQVWLDRAHFSPGEIDGKTGENLEKAIAAYAAAQGKNSGMSDELWQSLSERVKADPIIIEYKISESDVKGPFVKKIPAKFEYMKDLPALSYINPQEKIAEQFHMSPELLLSLNPNQKFDKPGETIMVTSVSGPNLQEKAQSIEVDKVKQTLKVFGKSKALIAVYPVTTGSSEKPAPDGTLKVTSVSKNPTYRYNPEYAFKGVKSKEAFTIKPGPNNPVGLVWIGLNKEGYGLHGTPEPSKVSKSESHGCIRLTNWDALQLASAVTKGIQVEFRGDEKDRPKKPDSKGKRHRQGRR